MRKNNYKNFNVLSGPNKSRSNNKIQLQLDHSKVVFIIIDKNGKINYFNNCGYELVNCFKENVTDLNWFDEFISDSKCNYIKSQFSKIIEDNVRLPYGFDDSIKINNELRMVRWQIFPILNNNDILERFICLCFDSTKLKKKDKIQQIILQILHASNTETNLNDFFKFIHSSVGELMPVNNFYIALIEKGSNIISFPYSFDQVDKSAPQKKIGKGLTDLVLANGKSYLIDEQKDKELIKDGEVELLGSPAKIWLGIPLKIQDNTIGALVVQDYENENTYGEKEQRILEVISFAISRAIERKIVEQEKSELINKLKELNSTKDKLISLISHDLRSPFNSLLGFSEILINEYKTLTDDEITEYLKVIYESSKNLFGMTNNLLQFSRFQMGKFEFKPTLVNLQKIVNRSLNLIKGNAVKKRINLSIEVNPDIQVFADEDMLSSIIQNLISNAIKFTNNDGEVKVIVLNHKTENEMVKILIQDNGIGISSEDLNKINNESIFSTPGTEREYGTGLGLLLVKEFVAKNSGTILINSNFNQGTTVCLTLPSNNSSNI